MDVRWLTQTINAQIDWRDVLAAVKPVSLNA